MSTNDYIKYLTIELVKYMEQPKEERKLHKEQRKSQKEPLSYQLFGILPLSIKLLVQKIKKNRTLKVK